MKKIVEDISVDTSKNLVVRQSNQLIEASYKMSSIAEIRIVRMLIAQIRPADSDLKTYRIDVEQFAKLFNLSPSNNSVYQMLYEASDALMDRKINIQKKDGGWLNLRWISSSEYTKGDGFVELGFDKKLRPYLIELKGYFTQYQINAITRFRSQYSIRLYEMLKMEQFKISHQTGRFSRAFDYSDLREKMGVGETEYKFFKDFRVSVIEAAKKEINNNPDICISEIEYLKLGQRSVQRIVFHCEIPKQTQLILEDEEPKLEEVKGNQNINSQDLQDLIGYGIAESTAIKWRKKYGIERIKRNIEYTASKQKLGKVRDPAGYLSRAIADDSASGWKNSEAKKKEEIHIKQVEATQTKAAEDQATAEKLELRKRLLSEFEAMPEDEKNRLTELICAKNKTVKTDYIRHGVDGAMFRTNLVIQLKKERGIA
jgi:plasmid replication initiation protein